MLLAIIFTVTTLAGRFLSKTAEASPYVISDGRIRNLDHTVVPSLGRGYSIMTNTYHSNCLVVDETTTPSYNYDCKFFFVKDSKMKKSMP